MKKSYITKSIYSEIVINADPEIIWRNITDVKIEQFPDPILFKLLDIPKPLKAEIIKDGEGGCRVAYFDTGKRFLQKIIIWNPYKEYSFTFNPEKGFKAGYFFELSEGVFRMLSGAYLLTNNENAVNLKLSTTYSVDKRIYLLINLPVKIILKIFQRFLLNSIKKNSENDLS